MLFDLCRDGGMADTQVLGTCVRKDMRVQVSLPALTQSLNGPGFARCSKKILRGWVQEIDSPN